MKHPHNYKTEYITRSDDAHDVCTKLLPLTEKQVFFGLDIETTYAEGFKGSNLAGLDPYCSRIRLLQIACEEHGTVYVFDLFKTYTPLLIDFLTKGNFFAHNAFFEQCHLLRFTENKNMSIYCTMVMYLIWIRARVDNPSAYRAGLDEVVKQTLEITVDKQYQTSDWSLATLSEEQIKYAARDASYCYTIGVGLAKKLMHLMPNLLRLNMQSIGPLSRMMNNGIYLDATLHRKLIAEWEEKSNVYIDHCFNNFGAVNFKSSMKLNEWLEENVEDDVLQVWPRTDSGKHYRTDYDTLSGFTQIPGIKHLCEYKKYTKLISTYGENLIAKINPRTGRLHCSYTLGYTTTGRLSSRWPNLQNLPRDGAVRRNFRHQRSDTVLICADYSQIELRCAAIISKDSAMLSAYHNGEDLHVKTAATITSKLFNKISKEERRLGKAVNFGLIFGMGAEKLCIYAKINYGVILSLQDSYKMIEAFRATYPEYRAWQLRIAEEGEQTLESRTISGMLRRLSTKNYYSCAMNTPVQGSAAEIMLRALIRIDRIFHKKQLDAKLILTVHDEVIVEARKENAPYTKQLIGEQMTKAYHDIFPGAPAKDLVEASIGDTWEEAK